MSTTEPLATVKCGDCGNSCAMDGEHQNPHSIPLVTRETGEWPTGAGGEKYRVRLEWFVLRHAPPAQGPQKGPAIDQLHTRLSVATEPRECNRFFKWHRGLTPREHLDLEFANKRDKILEDQIRENREWRDFENRVSDRRHYQQLRMAGL